MFNWESCKNILCVRPDNMGDLIMSGPAIRALKNSFKTKITILTSTAAAGIAALMPEIDEILVFDLPWVKNEESNNQQSVEDLIATLAKKKFDAAVIFTVCTQSPLPTAMVIYQARIPQVLAYCRENPYKLINHWIPDEEPYTLIQHQVIRDLKLVNAVGA